MFAGFDLSLTGTGFVIIDDNKNTIFYQLISTDKDIYISIEQRLLDIVNEILKCTIFSNIRYACVEGISYMSASTSLYERCGLFFLVTTELFKADISFSVIPPKSLKKAIARNGNASKEMMIDVVENQYNQNFNRNDNLCDAYGLALLALKKGIK